LLIHRSSFIIWGLFSLPSAVPLFCARCAAELEAGSGSFFQVTIEAVADPTPPVIQDADRDAAAIRARLEKLYAELGDVSAQEAMDQVHRRLTIFLCDACFRVWIENPVQ
jgi:hypothetical protein